MIDDPEQVWRLVRIFAAQMRVAFGETVEARATLAAALFDAALRLCMRDGLDRARMLKHLGEHFDLLVQEREHEGAN